MHWFVILKAYLLAIKNYKLKSAALITLSVAVILFLAFYSNYNVAMIKEEAIAHTDNELVGVEQRLRSLEDGQTEIKNSIKSNTDRIFNALIKRGR